MSLGLALALAGVVALFERELRRWGVSLIAIGLAAVAYDPGGRAPPSPEAMAAFRAIEARCDAASSSSRPTGCETVEAYRRGCLSDPPCTASGYHQALTEAGFNLPPLRGR